MGDIFIAFLKSLLYTLVLGTVLYFVGEALPRKPFHADKFPFRPYRWEKEGKKGSKIYITADSIKLLGGREENVDKPAMPDNDLGFPEDIPYEQKEEPTF